MREEKIINLFRENLTIGKTYSTSDIATLLATIGNEGNVTALTYNRWNKGMDSTLCLFEYLGWAKYKYIDVEEISKYSGNVIHVPQGENSREYLIGNFLDGKMTFINGYKNFVEWQNSGFNGVKFIQLNTKFTAIKADIKFKFFISEVSSKNSIDGYGAISKDSKLGKLFIGIKEGDSFNFNNSEYVIAEIL